MTSKTVEKNLPPAENLKRSFECAVRDIYEVGLTGRVSQYLTPIVQRAGTSIATSPLEAKQRAVSDAARALALLWKVPHHSSR